MEGCPNRYCRSVVPVIGLADMFNNKGLPPVTGGVLDQSNSFIEAARILDREEQIIKAEANG